MSGNRIEWVQIMTAMHAFDVYMFLEEKGGNHAER
jgi:hypothetical protein